MVKNGEFFMIKEMKQKGMYISHIAKELGRDEKTIRAWLKEEAPRSYQRKQAKPRKLDPFKAYIQQRMEEGCLNAVVIYDELKAQSYTGSITTLRYFMRAIRPAVEAKATVRFETLPGEQAQVDWGHFRVDWKGKAIKLYAFIMVLGYSRQMYLEFTEDEKVETLIGCHERAMHYFGGMTKTCLYDNMRTVVTGQDDHGQVIWNETFARFAAHHGFAIRRCNSYRPQTKGKVENGVGYVRKNFWPRVASFTDLDDLNRQARWWLNQIANQRVHGTTHEIPSERLKAEALLPMNPQPFEQTIRHSRKVSSDALISYQNNRYSVPFALVGQVVQLQDEKNGILRVYDHQNQLIAEHIKATGVYQVITNKKHFEGIRTVGNHKVPTPMPKLVTNRTLEVHERPLAVYEALSDEEVFYS